MHAQRVQGKHPLNVFSPFEPSAHIHFHSLITEMPRRREVNEVTTMSSTKSSDVCLSLSDDVWLSKWDCLSPDHEMHELNQSHFQCSHYISSCSSVSTVTTCCTNSESFYGESEDENMEKWLHSTSSRSLLSGSDEEQHSLPSMNNSSKRSRDIQIASQKLQDFSCEESPPKRHTSPLVRPAAKYAPNFNFTFSTGSFPPQAFSGSVQKSRKSLCATLGIFKPVHVCHTHDEDRELANCFIAAEAPSRFSCSPFAALEESDRCCSDRDTCDHLECLFDLDL